MITSSTRVRRNRRGTGFTLLELLVSLAVLLTVLGIVFQQIGSMQKMSSSEATKLDLTQQGREFINQSIRDVHMSGYPSRYMYASQPTLDDPSVAAGIVSATPTQILLEGDVNGDGQVYSVLLSYVAADPNDPNCPCVRRSAVAKVQAWPWAQPVAAASYTQAEHLVPPGVGPGQSGKSIFEFLNRTGNAVDLSTGNDISTPQGALNIASIATVRINLTLLASQRDAVTGQPVTLALSGVARPRQ